MNPIKKERIIVSIIIAALFSFYLAVYSGVFSSFEDSRGEFYNISYIDVMFTAEVYGPRPFILKHYRITNVSGEYYSMTGKKVGTSLIQGLADSFTDFYESDKYEDSYDEFFMTDYYPHFTVTVSLENGETFVLKTESNYHCFIPWNIEHNNKTYVQYNGRIPTALLRILVVVDEEEWSRLSKYIQWGCYPASVPERFNIKGVSQDSPESTPVVTSEEDLGKKHVLWEVTIGDTIIDEPHYVNGCVFVTAEHAFMCFNAQTGEKMWGISTEDTIIESPEFLNGEALITAEHTFLCIDIQTGEIVWDVDVGDSIIYGPNHCNGQVFVIVQNKFMSFDVQTGKIWEFHFEEQEKYSSSFKGTVLLGGKIYVSTPEQVVYCLDTGSGDVIWEYTTHGKLPPEIEIFENYLIVFNKEIVCLEKESGKIVWETTEQIVQASVREDKISFLSSEEGCYYRGFIDINTGAVIWKEDTDDIGRSFYEDGILYVDYSEERTFIALDTTTMEEIWSYTHGETVSHVQFLEDWIFLLIYDEDEEYLDRIVLLDKNGLKIWEYQYPEPIYWSVFNEVDFITFGDTIFFERGRGFIDAFDAETGEREWEIEVRGYRISRFELHEGRLYITANDGRLYCFDVETGDVIWFFETMKEYKDFGGVIPLTSEIEDDLIFLATREGTVLAFSLA